jgi:uncharacterized protein (DUF927 family)
LGRGLLEKEVRATIKSGLGAGQRELSALSQPKFREEPPDLTARSAILFSNWPFRVTPEGVFEKIEKENKQNGEVKIEWLPICSRLDVVAETRAAQGQNWGWLLEVYTREGQVNEWAMPMEILASDGTAYMAELLKLGAEIEPGRWARDGLHEYISTARLSKQVRCVNRVGWHGSAFILPDISYRPADGEEVLSQTTSSRGHAFNDGRYFRGVAARNSSLIV